MEKKSRHTQFFDDVKRAAGKKGGDGEMRPYFGRNSRRFHRRRRVRETGSEERESGI